MFFLPTVFAQGRLLPPQSISSAALGTNRTIRIYLPPSYDRETNRHYPVLYLHDGQNVFSSAGTNCCFGWGNWELDKTVDALSRDHKMREIIMVGIDCTSDRIKEYNGNHHDEPLFPGETNTFFEKYAGFLIAELKPKIDRDYRTLPAPTNTGVMGSSMGGICSVVLATDYANIFAKGACLSGAFQVDQTNCLNQLVNTMGIAHKSRIYLDSSVIDYTGGDDNRQLTIKAVEALRRLYGPNAIEYFLDNPPMTEPQLEKSGLRHDKWKEAQTSQHNEFYWRQRAWRPLTFLFPPE